MSSHHNRKYKDHHVLWALVGITLLGGFVGSRLEWRHSQIVSGNLAASAIGSLDQGQPLAVPHFVIGMVGDISLDKAIAASVSKNFGGDYSKLFAGADFLEEPDISFATLAGPASSKGASTAATGAIRMSPALIPAIKAAGIDVVSLATSHAGDYGSAALEDTIQSMQASGILTCGAGMDYADASRPAVVQQNGFRIGFLCMSADAPSTLAATANHSGILLASDPAFDAVVAAAAHQVNVLVVSFDWGQSGTARTPAEETLADKAIDDGAAFVAGSDGATQDLAQYHGKPIAFGLGNFVSDTATPASEGTYMAATVSGPLVQSLDPQTVTLDADFVPSLALPTVQTKTSS